MYQGIFIDNQDSAQQFAGLMSTSGSHGLQISFQKPRELMMLAQDILAHRPDLVALDYRLADPQKPLSSYKAGALAQLLRDAVMDTVTEDFPIILVSQQDELSRFFENVTAHDLFDSHFSKETLAKGNTQNQILSLVLGYKKLIQYWNEPERWVSLLDVTQPEKVEVAYQAIRELDKLKAPHQVARDILRYLINRQGLLLDKDNLLAQLGVAKTGKDVDAILELLKTGEVLYTGIFSEGWTRWWGHRLQDWGDELCGESLGNMTAKERVSCLNDKLGLALSPAKSRWQNHSDAFFGFACASCHQPTEREFAVLAYDPSPYRFVQRKSICWKCVETGEFEKHGLEIDDGAEFIVEKIRNGEIRSAAYLGQ
ncbi:MAG: hypothetical protein DRR16_05030 [Candidatus Parabeggiatoa sp. nov. 3]|nr:MAG: hypothetical protein DRR00_01630 [Gammaproteobacteria bacterium]RKZ68068.1 MAG: hypothetical protein DRQ99_04790 [Gammaproteobacteria bacterium]RKZ88413.1 MAG: hypothetical protein DRR16_05030 [Gammaproteobacteria bacterium]